MSIHMLQWLTVIFVPPVLLQEAAAPQLSARRIRFNQFASVLYQQEPYMTPRDFLYSVMLENVDRKMLSTDVQSVYSVHWLIRWVWKWCESWSPQSPDSSQASWTGGFLKIHWNCGQTVGKVQVSNTDCYMCSSRWRPGPLHILRPWYGGTGACESSIDTTRIIFLKWTATINKKIRHFWVIKNEMACRILKVVWKEVTSDVKMLHCKAHGFILKLNRLALHDKMALALRLMPISDVT